MRRADRLFRIVDVLRRRRFVTAAQLAERFEISERTVYRDVQDLVASGVPIRGEAGVGYRLDPSFQLPPLMFSIDEIEALVLGMRMIESWGDDELRASARSILDKVDGVVPERERKHLDRTALFSLSFRRGKEVTRHLGALRRAVNEVRRVTIAYADKDGAATSRTIRPLGLYFWGRTWTVAAWCEMRGDFRNFRTDRMKRVRVLKTEFELVSPCTLEDYVEAMSSQMQSG